jgi:hypothetical protein
MISKFSKLTESNDSTKFKVGLDLHGVIDALPDFFAFLTDSIVKNGGEVHIITGGSWTKELESQVDSMNIKWTHKFSVYDHLIEIGSPTSGEYVFPDGTIQKKFVGDVWDKAKSEYCRDNNINLHIDDTLIYNNFFTTPFCRLWTHNNKPKSPHKDVRHLD